MGTKHGHGWMGVCLATACLAVPLFAQESALLEEEKSFYNNFALSSYSKEQVEKQLQKFYDLFGEHITDGFYMYSLQNDRTAVSSFTIQDSTVAAISNERRDDIFYDNYRNLCYSKDAIGSVKMAIILGNQIRTRFTPLTFSKRNYEGIRWDWWYSGLGVTALMSRTRPGLSAFRYLGYGLDDQYDQRKITESWVMDPMSGIPGTQSPNGKNWLISDQIDWSARTMFGDYDFLWGLHASKRILNNKLNVGLTYINHHHSDIKRGEKWHGDVPNSLSPDEIHFEIYDNTFQVLSDPGALLHHIQAVITTTNRQYTVGPAAIYLAENDLLTQYTGGLPAPPKNGLGPVVCTFYPKRITGQDSANIQDISFTIELSGNYLVFVSTEKSVDCNNNYWDFTSGTFKHRLIEQMVTIPGDTSQDSVSVYSEQADNFMGDYIIRSPQLALSATDNHAVYNYHYRLPAARVTYGLDFDGELLGTTLQGEVLANARKEKYPTSHGTVNTEYSFNGYITADRPVTADKKLSVSGKLFNLAAEYQTSLPTYQVSRYFHVGRYKDTQNNLVPLLSFPVYPVVLGNDYNTVDDNEDDDYYVENSRSFYPSEMATNTLGSWWLEGTRRGGYSVALPSSDSLYRITYDDPDGVIPSRYDRNKNGTADYLEDFLLYQADPPVFDLDPDRNNNQVSDSYEDDIYPDYPVRPVYVYTSNGVASLGVQGVALALKYTPLSDLTVNIGGDYQAATDPDLLSGNAAAPADEYRAMQGYTRALYRLALRDAGLNLMLGEELRFVQDKIRDDVIEGSYYVRTDNLRFRNALVSNTAAAVSYLNIPDFELTAKLALSGEKHLAQDGKIYFPRMFYNPAIGRIDYEFDNYSYNATTILGCEFLTKMAYTFTFPAAPAYLGIFRKLKIIPQYKIMCRYYHSSDSDPRENTAYDDLVLRYVPTDTLWRAAVRDWGIFDDYNEASVLTVPIVRATYPLGDKTTLEFGWQWKRNADFLIKEQSYLKEARVVQITSTDNYLSYNIAFQLGWMWQNVDYDYNFYHPVYRYGTYWDMRKNFIFCRLFAGI